MMYYTVHYTSSSFVKCGHYHSAFAEALATAYSKEISNESCREASKARNYSVLRA